ncbi:MAG: thioredoxin family protein, partial [Pygmaiobacter sp.]
MGLFQRKQTKPTDCCGAVNAIPAPALKTEPAKTMVSVKVLGSGCAKCNALEAATKKALAAPAVPSGLSVIE